MRRLLLSRWLPAAMGLASLGCIGGCPGETPVTPGTDIVSPYFSDVSAYGTLVQGQPGRVSISATVAGAVGPVDSVVADLSDVGGSAGQPLSRATGNFWIFVGNVTPTEGGLRTITFTAADAIGLTSTATARLNVAFDGTSGGNEPPVMVDPDLQKIPLGQSAVLAGSAIAKVYVPSRHGGELTIAGAYVQLLYGDGSDVQLLTSDPLADLPGTVVADGDPCSYTVPADKHGWYYIRLTGGATATISSTFVETGQASRRPWNGWWWAWNPVGGPTLYDAGGPLEKYDKVYGTKAREWARLNESGGAWWWGHCWGWSIASVLLPEPQATSKNGVSFSLDDMKALYSAVADTDPYFDPDLSITYIPEGPPTAAAGEYIDGYCDDVYRILRTCVRENREPVQGDMRVSDALPPARVDEVWNQAIYKYVATFREAPAAGSEYVVQIEMQVWANYDLEPPPTDNSKDRAERFVYDLEFDAQGQVIANSARQNWISTSHYPPRELYRITGSSFDAPNPYLTKARIDGLYR